MPTLQLSTIVAWHDLGAVLLEMIWMDEYEHRVRIRVAG
jgi:hypothetical protein